jgi:hypothetical protein
MENETRNPVDRFVNNEILAWLSRPQYAQGCSIASLTTVINYLFAAEIGVRTQEQVAAQVGVQADALDMEGGPANELVLEWFDRFLSRCGLQGQCDVLFDGEDVEDAAQEKTIFSKVNDLVRRNDRILVYHLLHHYNLICGFFESATRAAAVYTPGPALDRWLILADPSSERDPLWSVRWENVRRDLAAYPHHCVLVFGR